MNQSDPLRALWDAAMSLADALIENNEDAADPLTWPRWTDDVSVCLGKATCDCELIPAPRGWKYFSEVANYGELVLSRVMQTEPDSSSTLTRRLQELVS